MGKGDLPGVLSHPLALPAVHCGAGYKTAMGRGSNQVGDGVK